jgi:hypothetical protein
MNQKITLVAAAAAAAMVALLALPAASAPVAGGEGLKAQTPSVVAHARSERRARKPRKVARRHAPARDPYRHRDTIGSIGYDGYGYGYNRFSGQRYMSCMFDEGYGRVRPCDAGGDGGRN